MAVRLKERKLGTLVIVIVVGILIGSYLDFLISQFVPGDGNVVKTFFTYNFINIGIGFPEAVTVNLYAIKFQLGFQMKFSLLSILGIFISLYFFRWYK